MIERQDSVPAVFSIVNRKSAIINSEVPMSAPQSQPRAQTPPSAGGVRLVHVFAALALAAGGCLVALIVTSVLGYGKDAHVLRLGALAACLFVGGGIAFWPGMKLPVRALALVLGIGGAAAAWWFVPASSGGDS